MSVTIGLNELVAIMVNRIAVPLSHRLDRRLYRFHINRVRLLKTPSMKLIYIFVLQSQPVSFTEIKKAVKLHQKTVDRCLRALLNLHFIELDRDLLYYVTPPD